VRAEAYAKWVLTRPKICRAWIVFAAATVYQFVQPMRFRQGSEKIHQSGISRHVTLAKEV
jgi:predicted nicotinamide N-methyase